MSKETASVRQQGGERDWVDEAYECFIKNATDLEPTDPVKAIGSYFERNATDELKERAKKDGKTPASCWRFIEAVARKALHGSGHIDPVAVYAIAMHYFQDVPADWNKQKDQPKTKTDANSDSPAKKPERKPSKKRNRKTQGFFFDMMETSPVGGSSDCANTSEPESEEEE